METIHTIVVDVIRSLSEKTTLDSGKSERIWQNSITSEERKHAHFAGIKDGVVSIVVDSSVWLYAMRVQQRQLLEALKKECPEVTQIRFKIGKTR